MQPSTLQLAVIVPVVIVALDSLRRYVQAKRERKGLPLPPGPPQLPLIGNAHSINIEQPWMTYTDWHAKYGKVVYLRLMDQDVIVLGSQSVAVQLMEKRSQVYSDRPVIASLAPYGGEINWVFAGYGDHWRFCRRIFHQTFRSEAALAFRPMQLRRARQLALNVTNNPDKYLSYYTTFSIAVAMSAAYDYEPKQNHDPIVELIEEYVNVAIQAVTPERSMLVKFFPFLLYLPDWFPGSSLKREARYAYGLSRKAVEIPFQYAEKRMKASADRPTFSMISDHLSRVEELDGFQREQYLSGLKSTAVTSIMAAEETTTSTLNVFTLAMVLNPHAWKRAQADIDTVVGKDRLPEFGDRTSLPYIDAIIRETLRWHPVVPMGIWHATSNSDIYDGYYIPKGAIVVANAWAMSRDENRFPNPEAFSPERYLDDDGMLNDVDPAEFIFGFGRRICPGRYTADASLWIAVATMLAAFDFCRAKDDQGNEISFEPKWLNGITHRPDVFPSQIRPRAHVNKAFLEQMNVE